MVEDALVRESRFEVTVINQPPTAMFSASLARGRLSGYLDASRSADPDRDELSYSWSFEGPAAATVDNAHDRTGFVAGAPGTYAIRLVVTDEEGATAEAVGSVRLYDSVFPPIEATPAFDRPVYAWAAGKLVFPGAAIGIVDATNGTLDMNALAGSSSWIGVTPNGQRVLIRHFGGPFEYYDAVGQVSIGTVDPPDAWTPAISDDASYWIVRDAGVARLQRYDFDAQQVYDTPPTSDFVHAPFVSTALGGVVLPIGTETAVERFEIYDFGARPALVATVAASLPWGTVDVFTGGDHVSVRGGPIYRITRQGVETLDSFGHDYLAFAHNPEAGVFAVLHGLRLRIYSDQTFALLEDHDLDGWIASIGWQRIFRHGRGFMVVQPEGYRIDNLFIEPDPG